VKPEEPKRSDSKEDTPTDKPNSDEIEAGYRESDEDYPDDDKVLTEENLKKCV
jgi:hypothetical protein